MPSRSQRKREGVMQQTMSLPHWEQGWLGGCIERWNALNDSRQNKKIKDARALVIAAGLTKSTKNTTAAATATTSIFVAVAAPESILDTHGLTILAIFIDTCGKANASTFLTEYKASGKSRKDLAKALVREACRYATAPAVRPTGPAPVDNTITLADIRREREAEEAAAAEALRIATFVPPALTPHMTKAYEMGMAGETLRLSADRGDQEILESGRKLAIKFHWRRIFVLLAQEVTLIHKEHLEQCIDRHVNFQFCFDEADAAYSRLWLSGVPEDANAAAVLKAKRARDTESWSNINALERGVAASYRRCQMKALMIAGVHILMRKWWKQAPKTAPRVKKHVRLTAAEKAVRHNEVVKQLLPSYLVARDISTFTKPVETIQTIRLGNLREARGDAQVRDLNQDIRSFIERNGGVITQERGAVFVPLISRTRQTQGYCFVKLTSPANARLLLDRLATLTHAMLIDSRTGEEREVFPELAASDRKTKEQMEAEKAKAAAAKRSEPSSVDSVSAAIKAAMRGPGGELKPICLAEIKREKMSAAEQALKDRIAAAFPTLSDAPTVTAKQFEVSFAAAAAKPLPEKVEVIDPFQIKVAGVEYALIAAPTTVIGKAQMALRQAAADALAVEERRAARSAKHSVMVEDASSHWLVERETEVKVVVAEKKEEVVYKSFQEAFKARLAAAAAKK